MMSEQDRALSALQHLDSGCNREQWVRIGMSAKAAGLEFDAFHDWSQPAGNYAGESDCRTTWKSFSDGKVTANSLFAQAFAQGWQDPAKSRKGLQAVNGNRASAPIARPVKVVPKPDTKAASVTPADLFARFEAATYQHPYIIEKRAAGVPLQNLRVVSSDDNLTIQGERMAGALVVPAVRTDGTFSSLQFIAPPDVAERLKAKGKPSKLNLPGAPMAGASFTVGPADGPAYLCEGIGAAWSCWQATGQRSVACFGWGNVRRVADAIRQSDASAKLTICPDVGMEADAEKIARDVGAAVARMPDGWPQNSDVNDLAQRDSADVLETLLQSASEPPVVYPLSVAFADELPESFTPVDELVQGVLTAGDGSVLYGDSNSGKTFFVIDMACAVARGVQWMNRQTEPGLVVYLAAESPASVRSRLQAYQKHHRVRVPNFAIVQSPIDLFDGNADTDAVIQLVRQLEAQRGQRARLIVGDTLARLSAGANENAGQDMGLVVRRIDRIRNECKAHFLLIHHSGKTAAAGARGWSGVRAAVDTEIEITDSPAGRCAEIMKQRDLATRGERIGFRLDTVTLGLTKWGGVATSCVVVSADAPTKPTGKRISEVGGAILEMLRTKESGLKKVEVAKHFDGRYEKSSIYREMKKLVESGQLHEGLGIVTSAEVPNGAN